MPSTKEFFNIFWYLSLFLRSIASQYTDLPQVPPFDIVEELNKSMELWVITDKPSPHKIHNMIIQVAKFLFEFARSSHASPDFLRLGIDLDSLNLFGESLEPEMRGQEMMSKKNSSHGELSFLFCLCSIHAALLFVHAHFCFPYHSSLIVPHHTTQASCWRTPRWTGPS